MSVGVRLAAHHTRIWRANRESYRARRRVDSVWACSSLGIATKVHLGMAGSPRYVGGSRCTMSPRRCSQNS
jgi:hypothetical protein